MFPVILKLGPITIYSYGTMMAIAFLVAGYLTSRELERKGMAGELASSMVVWGAIGGLVGSRIWALANDWQGFLHDPLSTLISGSGFVFYGGLIGGTIAVSYLIWREKLPWLKVVDCIAPGLAIAHAIGRIGCELAGDGDWGTISTLPWAHAYPNAIIGWTYPEGVRVHPTPIYETIAYTVIFAILWSMRKRPQPDGNIFWWYLVLAPAARFVIEFIRINPPVLFGLSEAQVFSIILIAIGSWRLLVNRGAHQEEDKPAALRPAVGAAKQ